MNCLKRGVSTCLASTVGALLVGLSSGLGASLGRPPTQWPSTIRESHPWAYWWWMGSAVDPPNLTRQLIQFQQAGFGGVHVIPIYGAFEYLEKCLAKIPEAFADIDYNLILVDDNSPFETKIKDEFYRAMAEKYKCTLVKHNKKEGFSAGL